MIELDIKVRDSDKFLFPLRTLSDQFGIERKVIQEWANVVRNDEPRKITRYRDHRKISYRSRRRRQKYMFPVFLHHGPLRLLRRQAQKDLHRGLLSQGTPL